MRRLLRLSLRAFRNYARVDLDLDNGTTVLMGPNGQGKSNLIEAVYMVATGRSYRTSNDGDVIRIGESTARVRAHIARPGRDEEIEITITRGAERDSTQMRVNGVVTTRGNVLGRLPVVLAAPWDLDLVRGSGSGRRRLLDATLAQLSPAYFFSLHRYHRVVTQRNAELRRRGPAGAPGAGVVDPWDAQSIALGVRITAHRGAHVDRLRPGVAEWFTRLGGEGRLDVVYVPSWQGTTDEERTGRAREYMLRLRADEYRRGVTLSGPHRDEIDLVLDGAPLRARGSQGQWRTATLAIRLADRAVMAAEIGGSPVLLLDDALAELDPERQRRVLEGDRDAQLLATATTVPDAIHPIRVLSILAGAVTEEQWSRQ
jgi:DNA replication and repair protein RecF